MSNFYSNFYYELWVILNYEICQDSISLSVLYLFSISSSMNVLLLCLCIFRWQKGWH